jgi:hypothetical protein
MSACVCVCVCAWDACSGKARVLVVKVEFMLGGFLLHLIFLVLLTLGTLRRCLLLKQDLDPIVVLGSRSWLDFWRQILEEAVEG